MPAAGLTAAVEADLCAALRGDAVDPGDPDRFAAAAVAEGLAPLLLHGGSACPLPPAADAALRADLHRQLGLAAVREPELRRVLDALANGGVDVLVVKGAHLAHALYPHPALRPRLDTDLLVRPAHRDAATRVLAGAGYERRPAITGNAVQGQALFGTPLLPAMLLDVHSRVASPVVAADLFDFDALWQESMPLPQLAASARAPNLLDALAIAAVHQAAHHVAEPRIAWRYDIHMLLRALDGRQVERFAERARARRMAAVCAAAIRAAEQRFPTAAGRPLLASLDVGVGEPSAGLLEERTPRQQAWMDVRALRGWRARAAYVAGHLFPPADYMRATYAPDSRAPLAWLYAQRLVSGARRWR